MSQGHTTTAIARRFRLPVWMVRRIFERGLLPDPPRIGGYRVIADSDIPAVEAALRQAGYLRDREPEAVPCS